MRNKLTICPDCFWKNNCGFLDISQKNCKTFTTKKEMIEKGYLPNEQENNK